MSSEWMYKDVYTKIPRIYEYVTLYGKRGFTVIFMVIDLKIGRSFCIFSLRPV